MPEVSLKIGDRYHTIACHEGEEAQLEQLGAMLDECWPVAQRAAGGVGGERAMLFVALMLADSLDEARRRPGSSDDAATLADVADRLEALAAALEETPAQP